MARRKMSWDWIKTVPIFCYTTFLDNNKFKVEVYRGKDDDQNSEKTFLFDFISEGVSAHYEAARQGRQLAEIKLRELDAIREEFRLEPRPASRHFRCPDVKVEPAPVWAASIQVPIDENNNKKWSPIYMGPDRKVISEKGKQYAIRARKCVRIHKLS